MTKLGSRGTNAGSVRPQPDGPSKRNTRSGAIVLMILLRVGIVFIVRQDSVATAASRASAQAPRCRRRNSARAPPEMLAARPLSGGRLSSAPRVPLPELNPLAGKVDAGEHTKL